MCVTERERDVEKERKKEREREREREIVGEEGMRRVRVQACAK